MISFKNIVTCMFVFLFALPFCQAKVFEDYKNLKTDVKGGQLKYYYELYSSAECSHTSCHDDPQMGDGKWDVNQVNDPLNIKAMSQSLAPHPTYGGASATFTANSTLLENGEYHVEGKITGHLAVGAIAEADQEINPCLALAGAHLNNTAMRLKSEKISMHDLHGNANALSEAKFIKDHDAGKITISNKGKYKDPITLSLIEVETGAVYSQNLFELNIDIEDYGLGECIFDNELGGEGVFLSCDVNDSINIYGSSNSDWLIYSYGDFSASLTGGIFTAAGVWADLPWDLVYENPLDTSSNVLSAFLSSDYLFRNLEWQIPENLMRDGYTYDLELEWSESGSMEAADVDVIPEPATLFLLSLGAIISRIRKK